MLKEFKRKDWGEEKNTFSTRRYFLTRPLAAQANGEGSFKIGISTYTVQYLQSISYFALSQSCIAFAIGFIFYHASTCFSVL